MQKSWNKSKAKCLLGKVFIWYSLISSSLCIFVKSKSFDTDYQHFMKQSANHLLNTSPFVTILKEHKIVVIDGGARGRLFPPFDELNTQIVFAVRFEPEPDSEIIKSDESLFIPKALWKHSGTINLNIAVEPSASSVYPPDNRILRQFNSSIDKRQPQRSIEVEAISIDEACADLGCPFPDFIKLDIHGSEYEALEGAANSLKKHTCGLLVENWVVPIHKGQRTRAAVELLLNDHDFYLFEQFDVASWVRSVKKIPFNKKQTIAYDSLFFKDIIELEKTYDTAQAMKFIGLAELFGHNGFAWQLNNYFFDCKAIDQKMHDFVTQYLEKKQKGEFTRKIYQRVVDILEKKLHRFS